jgi:hypothetical protein
MVSIGFSGILQPPWLQQSVQGFVGGALLQQQNRSGACSALHQSSAGAWNNTLGEMYPNPYVYISMYIYIYIQYTIYYIYNIPYN